MSIKKVHFMFRFFSLVLTFFFLPFSLAAEDGQRGGAVPTQATPQRPFAETPSRADIHALHRQLQDLKQEVHRLQQTMGAIGEDVRRKNPSANLQEAAAMNEVDKVVANRGLTVLMYAVDGVRGVAQQVIDGLIAMERLMAQGISRLHARETVDAFKAQVGLILLIVAFGLSLSMGLRWLISRYARQKGAALNQIGQRFFKNILPTALNFFVYTACVSLISLSLPTRLCLLALGFLIFGLKALRSVNAGLVAPLLLRYGIDPAALIPRLTKRLLTLTMALVLMAWSLGEFARALAFPPLILVLLNRLFFLVFLVVFLKSLWDTQKPFVAWALDEAPLSHPWMAYLRGLLRPVVPMLHPLLFVLFILAPAFLMAEHWESMLIRGILTLGILVAAMMFCKNHHAISGRLISVLPRSFGHTLKAHQRHLAQVMSVPVVLMSAIVFYELWAPSELHSVLRDPWVGIVLSKTVSLALIAGLVFAITKVGHRLIDKTLAARTAAEGGYRLSSLAGIFKHFWRLLVLLPGGLLMLSELGFNVTPIIASISVVSLGLGLASQHIFKDLFTGLFIVLENTIAIGDMVDIGGKLGTIEEITLRMVRLRSDDGTVHTLPFGAITSVSNLSHLYSCALINLTAGYDEDMEALSQRVQALFDDFVSQSPWRELVQGPLEIRGVSQLKDHDVEFQMRLTTVPGKQFMVKRAFLSRLKEALGQTSPLPEQLVQLKRGH